ncbi:hypothetical protein QUC31_005864, partial [Theobroma cacao]
VEKISNDNQTAPSSSEDRNQQFSSPSSSNKKLREPLDLRGSLSKSKFQDVSSASDASEANLKAMPYLDELESEKTTQDKTLSKIDGEIASEFSSRMTKKKTQDKTLSKSDGEIASQFSSSMTEIPDNELQLEESRNNKNPAKEKAVQEYPEPSRKLEEPSKSDGEITPEFSPSLIHQEQDHNQPTPSPSEDGNQQLMELPTDLHSLRIEGYASDKLPKEILGRSSLQHLYIIDCISLQSFPQGISSSKPDITGFLQLRESQVTARDAKHQISSVTVYKQMSSTGVISRGRLAIQPNHTLHLFL